MAEIQNIQWFPGHMAKTRRLIKECLPLIDAVAEIVDSRVPAGSRNPDLAELIGNKPRIILLNKCDMADPAVTDMWIKHYKDEGVTAIPVDCRTGKGLNLFKTTVKDILSDKLAQYREKGMVGKPLRVMVVGIPNVGKSSFINRMVGASRAKVENRPGVTRGNQWFKIDNELELLDTPGVLWPKLDDALAGEYLAFTGAVKDDVLDIEWLAVRLLEVLSDKYMDLLTKTYGIEKDEPYEMLCAFAKKRGMLIRGGEYDTERAANILMAEFRTQKIGRITLEVPNA